MTFGNEAPDITVNGERLVVLDEGRYFVAHVPAGFPIVTSGKKKDNRVELDTRAGETYYFRARAHPGKMFARFELFRVTKDEAKQDADKLHYVKPGDIKSNRVVKDGPFHSKERSIRQSRLYVTSVEVSDWCRDWRKYIRYHRLSP